MVRTSGHPNLLGQVGLILAGGPTPSSLGPLPVAGCEGPLAILVAGLLSTSSRNWHLKKVQEQLERKGYETRILSYAQDPDHHYDESDTVLRPFGEMVTRLRSAIAEAGERETLIVGHSLGALIASAFLNEGGAPNLRAACLITPPWSMSSWVGTAGARVTGSEEEAGIDWAKALEMPAGLHTADHQTPTLVVLAADETDGFLPSTVYAGTWRFSNLDVLRRRPTDVRLELGWHVTIAKQTTTDALGPWLSAQGLTGW